MQCIHHCFSFFGNFIKKFWIKIYFKNIYIFQLINMQEYYSVDRFGIYISAKLYLTNLHSSFNTPFLMNEFIHLKSETHLKREWWIEKGRMKGKSPFWRALQAYKWWNGQKSATSDDHCRIPIIDKIKYQNKFIDKSHSSLLKVHMFATAF